MLLKGTSAYHSPPPPAPAEGPSAPRLRPGGSPGPPFISQHVRLGI